MARKKRSSRPGRLFLLLVAAAALVGIGYLVGQLATTRVARRPAPPRAADARRAPAAQAPRPLPEIPVPIAPITPEPEVAKPQPAPTARGASGRIAIVIDDLGRSLSEVDRLLALGVPLTYAVLPWEKRTAEVRDRLAAADVEILCHLPMEASGGENPGPNAILERQPPRRIAALTRSALDALPGAIGLNNHMGSRITADRVAMNAVLRVVADRGLLFLDSRTSANTVAFDVARELAIPAARRDVFLDEDPRPEAIEAELDRLLDTARANGAAIAIGHPRSATLAALEQWIPRARAEGYELVPLSFLVERSESLEQ